MFVLETGEGHKLAHVFFFWPQESDRASSNTLHRSLHHGLHHGPKVAQKRAIGI